MSSYYLAYGGFKYFTLRYLKDRRPFGCSLAPTIECNLKCKHCYEVGNRASGGRELSTDELENLAETLANQGMKHCTLTDGEPILAPERCEVIIKHFWMNYIVTNGTLELPDFPATYILSLDGPPGVHDQIRGQGVFQRLKQNMKSASTDNIYALCTLNTINHSHIRDTVETAKDLGLKGIMFNWHTPKSTDDTLWVDYETRNKDIDRLIQMIEQEPDFIYNTGTELEILRTPDWSNKCPAYWVPSYDAFGNLKKPCIFGQGAICERCGCNVYPALRETVSNGSDSVQLRIAIDHADKFWTRDGKFFGRVYDSLIAR